ncbi:hypothetical protein BH11BAC3_BH11BAC3_38010 [soil metagenome]
MSVLINWVKLHVPKNFNVFFVAASLLVDLIKIFNKTVSVLFIFIVLKF